MKRTLILTALIILTLIPFTLAANDFSYNRLYEGGQIIDGLNYSINTNMSDWWNTVSLGPMDDVNSAQFDNIAGTLTIDESWVNFRWLRLDGGNSPTADINWDNNSITNMNNLSMNGQILIEFDDNNFENSSINIINHGPFGIAGQRFVNNRNEEFFISILGHNLSQALVPGVLSENDSAMGLTGDGVLFLSTLNNRPIILGSSPNRSIELTDFFLRVIPELKALEWQGNKFIRPVITDGVQSLAFESNVGAEEGELTFIFSGSDSDNNSVIQRADQIGKNNSASIQGMNSQIVAPKDFLTMPASVKAEWDNNTGDPIIEEWFTNITSCLVYEEYLQGLPGFNFLSRGLSSVCDTTGQGVPTSILGYIESVGPLTAHGGATVFDILNYVGDNGNDVNMLFNGGLENGKLHIRDKRQIEANITFFSQVITDFDGGTISPFVSESITPEVGRDWDSVLELQCHEDRCGNAKGGNEKIMAFSASTTFEGGTVASSNSRLMFWITSVLSGGDLFEVELDNNEGDVTTIYSTGATLVDEFINVSFGAAFENKSNVTTRFILNGQNIIREVWVDIIRVTSEPATPIIINETFDGGKIVLGEDMGDLSCLIEADKKINNDTLDTEWVMNIGSTGCAVNIAGNITFTDSTVVNQTVLGDQLVTGDLTVDGTISEGGELLQDKYFLVNGSSTMQGNANFGFNNAINISTLTANTIDSVSGTGITVNDDLDLGSKKLLVDRGSIYGDFALVLNGNAAVDVALGETPLYSFDTLAFYPLSGGIKDLGTQTTAQWANVWTDLINGGTLSGNNSGDQDLSTYVVGPASATDNTVATYDGTTGKLIQNTDWTMVGETITNTDGFYGRINLAQDSTNAVYGGDDDYNYAQGYAGVKLAWDQGGGQTVMAEFVANGDNIFYQDLDMNSNNITNLNTVDFGPNTLNDTGWTGDFDVDGDLTANNFITDGTVDLLGSGIVDFSGDGTTQMYYDGGGGVIETDNYFAFVDTVDGGALVMPDAGTMLSVYPGADAPLAILRGYDGSRVEIGNTQGGYALEVASGDSYFNQDVDVGGDVDITGGADVLGILNVDNAADSTWLLPTPVAFSNGLNVAATGTSKFLLQGTAAFMGFIETNGVVDEKVFSQLLNNGEFRWYKSSDDLSVNTDILTVDMTNGDILIDNNLTVGGDLNVTGDITTNDRYYLPNNFSIGSNSTCMIFYNSTGGMMNSLCE